MKNTLIGLTVLALVAGAVAQTGRAEYQARMNGQGKGKASWKTRDQGTQLQAELQVEGENLARNTAYKVTILTDSFEVQTDALGRYSLVRRYRSNARPNIGVGTQVDLFRADGTVAQTGNFVQTR
jgi:hypothetical protein